MFCKKNVDSNFVCGTENDVCRVDQCGNTSCCNGYKCVLPDGDYQYKICTREKRKIGFNFPMIKLWNNFGNSICPALKLGEETPPYNSSSEEASRS
jgi:hypothetical protein